MFVQSIDVDGVPVTQGEVIHVDEDGIIGYTSMKMVSLEILKCNRLDSTRMVEAAISKSESKWQSQR